MSRSSVKSDINRLEYEWLFLEDIVPRRVREIVRTPLCFAVWTACLTCAMGAIALLLAWQAHAFINSVAIDATLNVPAGDVAFIPLKATVKHVYGYFGELNHGIFYVLVAPAFVFLSLNFCRSVGDLMADMATSGLLLQPKPTYLVEKLRTSPWQKLTRWAFIPLLVAPIFWNSHVEYGSRKTLREVGDETYKQLRENEQKNIRWRAIGYVQIDFLDEWIAFFNEKAMAWKPRPWDFPKSRAEEIDGYIFGEGIRTNLGEQLDGLSKTSDVDLRHFFAQSALKFDEAQKLVISPEGLRWLESQKLLTFHARNRGGFVQYGGLEKLLHQVFLCFTLTLEGAFHGYAFWMAVKLITFFIVLRDLIPDRGDKRLSVCPFLYDPERRFGLDSLFRCYNQIAVLLALGASFLILVSMNAIESQSVSHPFHLFGLLNAAGLAVVFIALLTLVLGPFIFASSALKKQQREEIEKLNLQLNQLRARDADTTEIYNKVRIVKSQTTWPRTDAAFLTALGICLVALAFPFPVLSQLVGKQGEEWITLARAVQKSFHTIISPG